MSFHPVFKRIREESEEDVEPEPLPRNVAVDLRMPTLDSKHRLLQYCNNCIVLLASTIENIQTWYIGMAFDSIDPYSKSKPRCHIDVEERYANVVTCIRNVRTYLALRGSNANLDNIPGPGFNGKTWFKEIRALWKDIQFKIKYLRDLFLARLQTVMLSILIDIGHHATFALKHMWVIQAIMEAIRFELAGQSYEKNEAWLAWEPMMADHIRYYQTMRTADEHLVPDAGDLEEEQIVNIIAGIFRLLLERWDDFHGLHIPRIHRMFTIMAVQFPQACKEKRTNLQTLFIDLNPKEYQ
jgi:hypothetical protein